MSPYVDLKPATCMMCGKPARVKMVTLRHGLYIVLCLEHLREFAKNMEDNPQEVLT